MRWFKHLTTSSRDEKLMRLRDEFGVEGYGLYWLVLELIAEQCTANNNKVFIELSPRNWRKTTEISPKKFQLFLTFTQEISLFSVEKSEKLIKVSCPNLLKYRDEYTRKKGKNSGQTPDNVAPETETETETETEEEIIEDKSSIVPERSGTSVPVCPQKEIIQAYHETLPALPKIKSWPESLQKFLRARWREDPERQSVNWWRDFFKHVSMSDFLMGKKNDFQADLEWLVRPTNFVKIQNGRYHKNGQAHTSQLTCKSCGAYLNKVHFNSGKCPLCGKDTGGKKQK